MTCGPARRSVGYKFRAWARSLVLSPPRFLRFGAVDTSKSVMVSASPPIRQVNSGWKRFVAQTHPCADQWRCPGATATTDPLGMYNCPVTGAVPR